MVERATTEYRICSRCIMDTSDPGIYFDEAGVCNRCRDAERRYHEILTTIGDRPKALERLVAQIKTAGKNHDYDCIIGVSGGVDSTYVAYLTQDLGLRPLAVHLDNGWNSALAVSNIENCLKILGIDLFTYVLDWDEFRDLQLAFLKASTPDSEIPTDHAIIALLMHQARRIGVRYLITGENIATEGIFTPEWSRGHGDWRYIRSIHQQFGNKPLRTYPHYSLWEHLWTRYVAGQQRVRILDYVDYNKTQATALLKEKLNWQPYKGKHHESIYTRFYQCYILPQKFGFDKRRWHLSDLILRGEMSRDAALSEMTEPPCPPEIMREDKLFVAKKLGLDEAELNAIMANPFLTFWDYPSYESSTVVRLLKKGKRVMTGAANGKK